MENNFEQSFDMTPKKTINKKLFIIPVVCIVLILAGFLAAMKAGAFASPAQKVESALARTFKDSPKILKQLDVNKLKKIISSGNATVEMEMQMPEGGVDLVYAQNADNMQVNGNVSIPGMNNIDFAVNLNDKELQVGSSLLSNKVLSYNYIEQSEGLFSQMLEASGLEISSFNEILGEIYSSRNDTESYDDTFKILKEEMDALEYNKLDSAEFTVGDKNVKCKGFSTTISNENVKNIAEKYKELLGQYDDLYDKMGMNSDELMSSWDELTQTEFEVNMKFYIYKNKLAAIMVEAEGETVKLLLKGEDNRTYDMEVVAGDETVLLINGSSEGTAETYELKSPENPENVFTIVYDSETMVYEMKAAAEGENFLIKGKFGCSDDEFIMSLDEVAIPGEESEIAFNYVLNNKAEMKELSGEVLDVNAISEDDFLELYQSIAGVFMPDL